MMSLHRISVAWLAVAGVLMIASLVATTHQAEAARPQDSVLGKLDVKEPVLYFIADGKGKSGYRDSDRELALWALQAWQRAAGTNLRFVAASESKALVRVYWAEPDEDEFGETRAIVVNGRRGAAVYVRPDTNALGPDLATLAKKDDLMRESIVYLTCLHELGHAMGLDHTDNFLDIMYYFGYGGDIPGYFGRYRAKLNSRADIAHESGLSDGDVKRIGKLYAQQ